MERASHRRGVTVDRVIELYHRDLPEKDIAQILGCSIGTISNRLREAGISKRECYSRSVKLHWQRKDPGVPR